MKVFALALVLNVLQTGICWTNGFADDDLADDEFSLSVNQLVDDAPTLHVSQLMVHVPAKSYAYVVLTEQKPMIGVKIDSANDTRRHATITLAAQSFAVRDEPHRVQGQSWSCRTEASRMSTTISGSAELGKKPNEGAHFIRLTAKSGRYKRGSPIEIFTVNGHAYVLYVTMNPVQQDK